MKIKWLAALVIALTLIAVGPETARAGAGGPGASVPVPVILDCYSLQNTANTGFIFEVNDQFGTQQHVRLGRATMVCTRSIMNSQGGSAILEQGGAFNQEYKTHAGTPLDLKCYDVPTVPAGPVSETVKVIDIFGTDTTEAMHLSMVCLPAFKEVVP